MLTIEFQTDAREAAAPAPAVAPLPAAGAGATALGTMRLTDPGTHSQDPLTKQLNAAETTDPEPATTIVIETSTPELTGTEAKTEIGTAEETHSPHWHYASCSVDKDFVGSRAATPVLSMAHDAHRNIVPHDDHRYDGSIGKQAHATLSHGSRRQRADSRGNSRAAGDPPGVSVTPSSPSRRSQASSVSPEAAPAASFSPPGGFRNGRIFWSRCATASWRVIHDDAKVAGRCKR